MTILDRSNFVRVNEEVNYGEVENNIDIFNE